MVHAHEILMLIGDNERQLTKDSLENSVKETFGENAVFTNCSGNPYGYDGIFQFFIEKDKIRIDKDGAISLQLHNICSQ